MDLTPLAKHFSADSKNDKTHKQLWIASASLFIPQIAQLTRHTPQIEEVTQYQNPEVPELQKTLAKFGSDKSTKHNYHIMYSYILSKLGRQNPLRFLEVGMGTNDPKIISSMGVRGKPGASLKAFENYLPQASIFGADIDKKILFNAGRIQTTYVDQLKYETLEQLYEKFDQTPFDLIIDDGLHSIGANLNTLIFGLSVVKPDGWVVIEDIGRDKLENWTIVDYILSPNPEYETHFVNTTHCYMYVIHKLP